MEKILVVDDMAVFREPIATALTSHGYKTSCAKHGAAALISLDYNVPDLILLDLVMPEMDGLTLLAEIRNHPRWCTIPVVLLTSSADKDVVVRAKHLSVAGYILKTNFSLTTLLGTVEKALQKSSLMSETEVTAKSGDAEKDSRSAILQRIRSSAYIKRANGILSELFALSISETEDAAHLCRLINRDPLLSVRILQQLNSEEASDHVPVVDLPDGLRRYGYDTFFRTSCLVALHSNFARASALSDPVSFELWHETLAIGIVSHSLTTHLDSKSRRSAYLASICMRLPKILIRQEFDADLDEDGTDSLATTKRIKNFNAEISKIPESELAHLVLKQIALPELAAQAIQAFFLAKESEQLPTSELSKTLWVAEKIIAPFFASHRDRSVSPIVVENFIDLIPTAVFEVSQLNTTVEKASYLLNKLGSRRGN